MEIEPAQDALEEDYQRFVLSSSQSNFCQDIAWKRIIQSTYGEKPAYFLCRAQDGSVAGVASAFRLDPYLLAHQVVSLPYLPYGGIAAENEDAQKLLLDELLSLAISDWAGLELKSLHALPGQRPAGQEERRFLLELPRGDGAEGRAWRSAHVDLQDAVLRALSQGIRVSWGRAELLDEFYRLHIAAMQSQGKPVHSRELYRNTLAHLPGAQIGLASTKGGAVAGLWRVRWKEETSLLWPCHPPGRLTETGACLYWSAIREALMGGCRGVDLGSADPQGERGLFLSAWGCTGALLRRYCFDHLGKPLENGGRHLTGFLTVASGLWSWLPARYATRLGTPLRSLAA